MKTVKVNEDDLIHCFIKSAKAQDMSKEETDHLICWCDRQTESFWEYLTLQEILNVYRASAKWDTFEAWVQEEPDLALAAYNKVVSSVKAVAYKKPLIRY